MERGGWKTDRVMKQIYTHTFEEQRIQIDNIIDSYFSSMYDTKYDTKEKKYRKYDTFRVDQTGVEPVSEAPSPVLLQA